MNFELIKEITIPEGKVQKILLNGIAIWAKQNTPTIDNKVHKSVEADGITIYNTSGYKDGYRVRSGGAEDKTDWATCTGFIKVERGQKIRIYPPFQGSNVANAINFSNGDRENLGQITDTGSAQGICAGKANIYKTTIEDGVSTLTLTEEHDLSIAYIRITHLLKSNGGSINSGSEMIVTLDQEIPIPN